MIDQSQIKRLVELAEVAVNPRWGYRFIPEKRDLYLRRQLESSHVAPTRFIVDWLQRGLDLTQIEAEVDELIAAAQTALPPPPRVGTRSSGREKLSAEQKRANTLALLERLKKGNANEHPSS